MYKQVLLTAYEAYQATNIQHKIWEPKEFSFLNLISALSTAQANNGFKTTEYVLFLNMSDLSAINTDSSFMDHFDPVTRHEITNYGYLGRVCGMDVYKTPDKERSQLRERNKISVGKEALQQLSSLLSAINDPNFSMAEQQPN